MIVISTRANRIHYAQYLIAQQPYLGKRGLQHLVKQQYGMGLRDDVIREILRQANTPNVLRARINTPAFFRQERRELKQFIRKAYTPYLVDAVNARYTAYKDAMKQYTLIGSAIPVNEDGGYSYRKFIKSFHNAIVKQAREQGWIITKVNAEAIKAGRRIGQIDIYKVLKHYRSKRIEAGDYKPPVKPVRTLSVEKTTRNIKLLHEKTRQQQREARRNELTKRIDFLDSEIPKSTGDTKRELINQWNVLQYELKKLQ